jgi:hypothetical protein
MRHVRTPLLRLTRHRIACARGVAGALAGVVLVACADRQPTAPSAASRLTPEAPLSAERSGRPTRLDVPDLANVFVLDAGVACPFAVAGEPVVNRLVTQTFPADANGDVLQLTTGTLVQRLTNVSTGKSIIVNISGPGRLTLHADGSATLVAVGTWLIADVVPVSGPPTLFTNSGRTVLEIPAGGGPGVVTSRVGNRQDICAALS